MGHIPNPKGAHKAYITHTHTSAIPIYNAEYSCISEKVQTLSIANHRVCDTVEAGTRANNDFSFTDGGGGGDGGGKRGDCSRKAFRRRGSGYGGCGGGFGKAPNAP